MKQFAALATAFTLAAQDPQYAVQSRLVLVPVTVTDAKGHTVDGLESEDFIVLDNGHPQKATVDTIATGVAPIALVVAIQTSGISKPVLEKVRKIGAMIQPIVTGERGCAAVMSFSDRITWIQECTGSSSLLERALEQVRPEAPKAGRMLDAVQASVDRLRQRPNSRRVLLLISETRDRGSDLKMDQIVMAVEAQGVTVYAATYSAFAAAFTTKSSATGDPQAPKIPKTPSEQTGTLDGGSPHCTPAGCPSPPVPLADQRVDLLGTFGELARLGKTNTTNVLTRITGGITFPFTRQKGLEEAIEKLGEELNSQYVLSYTPDDRRGGYHSLEVRVTRNDLRIRARPGYWSTQSARQ